MHAHEQKDKGDHRKREYSWHDAVGKEQQKIEIADAPMSIVLSQARTLFKKLSLNATKASM